MAAINLGPMMTAVSGIATIVVPLLAVAAAFAVLYVKVKGIRIVVDAIKGRIETEKLEGEFRKRYAREQKNQKYRHWKAQGGPNRRRARW